MSAKDRLSYSRLYKYLQCARAYQFSYLDGVWPKAGTVSVDSWIDRNRGTVLHAIMEALFTGRTAEQGAEAGFAEATEGKYGRDGASKDKQEALRERLPDLIEIGKRAGEFMRTEEWEPVMFRGKPLVEGELAMPIKGWKDLYGKLDLVARHKPTGFIVIVDYKSTTRFEDPEKEVYRAQMAIYAKLCRENGIVVHGAGILQMKPTLPKRGPRKLRIDEGGFDQVRESVDGCFRWIPTLYSAAYQDSVFAEFEKAAVKMAEFRPGVDNTANISSFSCSFCDLRMLCQAQLQGQDAEYILNTKYQVSTRKKTASLTTVDF